MARVPIETCYGAFGLCQGLPLPEAMDARRGGVRGSPDHETGWAMDEEGSAATAPEADARFVVTVNGPAASSEVVAGLDGVREAFLQAVWRGPRDAVPDDLGAHLASLGDPAAWAAHGRGDGRPFWHWWLGLKEGSVAVQRVTAPLPADPRAAAGAAEHAARLRQVAAAVAACAAELRAATGRSGGPLRLILE